MLGFCFISVELTIMCMLIFFQFSALSFPLISHFSCFGSSTPSLASSCSLYHIFILMTGSISCFSVKRSSSRDVNTYGDWVVEGCQAPQWGEARRKTEFLLTHSFQFVQLCPPPPPMQLPTHPFVLNFFSNANCPDFHADNFAVSFQSLRPLCSSFLTSSGVPAILVSMCTTHPFWAPTPMLTIYCVICNLAILMILHYSTIIDWIWKKKPRLLWWKYCIRP